MINEQALKDRLRFIAHEKKIHFNACWKQLLLERFLARLSRSEHAAKLIFKGGFLLAYFIEIGRETIDLDFLLTRMKAEEQDLRKILSQINSIRLDDGFLFSFSSIEVLNQPHMDYPGYRIVLNASFAKMKDRIYLDIGIGDVVEPLTYKIPLVQFRGKPLFENDVSLLVYPVETIFSEKLETVLSKGSGNSRMKDYHDLFLLLRNEQMLDLEKLKKSINSTFSNRETPLQPIAFEESSLRSIQKLWSAHLNNLGDIAEKLNLPSEISDVIDEINKCLLSL